MALHPHLFGPADGPPLLVLHGVTNTGARYRRLAEEELPGVRAIAPDLRGHADSTWEPPWGIEQHVADVLELLDVLGLERVPVAGHSFGGLIGASLAATAPERVERLALIDPAIALPPTRALADAEAARSDDGWATPDEARVARMALRPAHAQDTVDEDLAVFLRREADGRYRLRYCRATVVAAYGEMARAVPPLDGYPGDVLLVTALQADYVTPALVEALRRDVGPRLREEGIDAGHMLAWDARAELGALLRGWLGR